MYNPSKSKDYFLKDPILRVVQRLLAYTFSGWRDTSGTLTKTEFYFLWCMVNQEKLNFGCWLASQFQSVVNKPNKPLILGSIITFLSDQMIALGIGTPTGQPMHVACLTGPLNVDCLE